jgi:hypothetical protein
LQALFQTDRKEYRNQYGLIDWEKVEEDSNGFDPDILSLPEATYKELNALIQKNNPTGQSQYSPTSDEGSSPPDNKKRGAQFQVDAFHGSVEESDLEPASKSSMLDKTQSNDRRAKENSALRSMVGEQPQGDRVYRTITEAVSNDRGSGSSTKTSGRIGWEKERFLGQLAQQAKENDTWVENVESLTENPISSGQENEVHFAKDGKNVIKANNLFLLDEDDSGVHTSDFNTFLDRIHSHNTLFSNAPYKIIGFTKNSKGEISVILEQPYIKNAEYATLKDAYIWLRDNGFKPKKLSNGVEGFSNGKYEISDVKPENVLKDKNGTLYFIDTEINSLKSDVTGKYQGMSQFSAPQNFYISGLTLDSKPVFF